MRKLIALLLVLGLAVFSGNALYAQDSENQSTETESTTDEAADTTAN
jgi:hypothetical protein